MKRRACKYLHDILEMAALIDEAISGKSFDDYVGDIALRHQVERELIIIGEAVVQLAHHDAETAEQLHRHREVIGLRNILAHRYSDVNNATIWSALKEHIPALVREVDELLEECRSGFLRAQE